MGIPRLRAGVNSYVEATASATGFLNTQLPTSQSIPFELAVSTELIAGLASVIVGGTNPSLSAGNIAPLHSTGALVLPTVAGTVTVASDSIADVGGDIGAIVILLVGLDASRNELQEGIVMNGDTAVVSTLNFLRINLVQVVVAGTNKTNVGTISCSIGGNVMANVLPERGVAVEGVFSVPVNHLLLMNLFNLHVSKGDNARLFATVQFTDGGDPLRIRGIPLVEVYEGSSTLGPPFALNSIGFSDVDLILEADNIGGAGPIVVTGLVSGVLVTPDFVPIVA